MTIDFQSPPIRRLTRAFGRGRGTLDSGWFAICPLHKSYQPALQFLVDGDRILLSCAQGCAQADVLATQGLSIADLRFTSKPSDATQETTVVPVIAAGGGTANRTGPVAARPREEQSAPVVSSGSTASGEKANYFIAATSWVLREDCTLSMKARVVLLVIANHMWFEPEWVLSAKLIAKEAGTSERTVWTAVEELARARYLLVRSGSMAGSRRANTYTLMAPFTTVRKKGDSRNSCEGQEPPPLQKVSLRKPRPPQKTKATLATFAHSILLQSLQTKSSDAAGTEAPEEGGVQVDLDRLVQSVSESHHLVAFPGARRA